MGIGEDGEDRSSSFTACFGVALPCLQCSSSMILFLEKLHINKGVNAGGMEGMYPPKFLTGGDDKSNIPPNFSLHVLCFLNIIIVQWN